MTRRLKKRHLRLLIALLVTVAGLYSATLTPDTIPQTAKQAIVDNNPGFLQVTQFYDGDTIAVNIDGKDEKIRLIGVDTPETHDPRKPIQCFGQAASDYTRQLIGTQKVRLEADPEGDTRDRYGRLLRYVYLPDTTLVNAKLIQDGYGFAYVLFPFSKLEEFRGLQQAAREQNRGLWGSCPVATSDKGQMYAQPAQ